MKTFLAVVVLALAAPLSAAACSPLDGQLFCNSGYAVPQRNTSQDISNQLRDIRSEVHDIRMDNLYRDMYSNSY